MLTHAVFSASFHVIDENGSNRDGTAREDMTAWLAGLVGSVQDVAGTRYRVVDIRTVNVCQGSVDYHTVFAHTAITLLDPVLWEPEPGDGEPGHAPIPAPTANLKVVAYATDGSRIAVEVDSSDFPNGGPFVRNLLERQALTDVLASAHGSALRLTKLSCHWDGEWPETEDGIASKS